MAPSTGATSATAPCVAEPTELLGRPVQLRGSALARGMLAMAGWRIRFAGLPARQGVAIVYPHTSNWDFVVGILAKWAVGMPVTFWGKASLFDVPLFGRWLRWLGGRPVQRDAPNGVVGQMAQALRLARDEDRFMWLALAPEGTRRFQDGWRSGFYHVALAAEVPVALVYFDFRERMIGIEKFIALSGDVAADTAFVSSYLGHRAGARRHLAAPVKWNV